MDQWIVNSEESSSKLIDFLHQKFFQKYSKRQIKAWIESSSVQVNSRFERFASRKLGKGDRVSFKGVDFVGEEEEKDFDPKRILYNDEYLLAYDKPAGLTSEGKGSVEELLRVYDPKVQLLHRLDRETSGVLLFARSLWMKEEMQRLFRQRKVKKVYLAWVDGVPRETKGLICNFLGKKCTFEGQSLWGKVPKSKGLEAETAWVLEESWEDHSLLRCFPKTGRTHQIRVHLASIGHPVLGDFQYAKQFVCSKRPKRHLLHAEKVEFIHPKTKLQLSIPSKRPIKK